MLIVASLLSAKCFPGPETELCLSSTHEELGMETERQRAKQLQGRPCGSMKEGMGSVAANAAWVGIGTMAQDFAGFHWETLGRQHSGGTSVKCLNPLQSKLSLLLCSETRVTARLIIQRP